METPKGFVTTLILKDPQKYLTEESRHLLKGCTHFMLKGGDLHITKNTEAVLDPSGATPETYQSNGELIHIKRVEP